MISLTINGELHTLDVDPATPLLWVIRDHVGLTGTKFGCGNAYGMRESASANIPCAGATSANRITATPMSPEPHGIERE